MKDFLKERNNMNLQDYVMKYAVRGACTCGRCIDAPENPEKHQPTEDIDPRIRHTVNLTFFKVTSAPGADADTFRSLVQQEHPEWLDGQEHNYLQVGGDVGDQGLALMCIGLGHVLGVWNALAPETMMPYLPDDLKQQMAGMGMIALQFIKGKAHAI